MRRRGRVDENQRAVVEELRAHGVSVHSLAAVGAGVPDLLCGWQGRNWLFEVKNPRQKPSDRRLTPDEREWHAGWRGQVTTVETAAAALAVMRNDLMGGTAGRVNPVSTGARGLT